MDQLGLETAVDLFSQVFHVNVDHVCKSIIIDAPDMLSDHRTAENLVPSAEQKFEQRVFLGGQVYRRRQPGLEHRLSPSERAGPQSGAALVRDAAHFRRQQTKNSLG